jgi:hypothetical protein
MSMMSVSSSSTLYEVLTRDSNDDYNDYNNDNDYKNNKYNINNDNDDEFEALVQNYMKTSQKSSSLIILIENPGASFLFSIGTNSLRLLPK